jgi:hypothetical protein
MAEEPDALVVVAATEGRTFLIEPDVQMALAAESLVVMAASTVADPSIGFGAMRSEEVQRMELGGTEPIVALSTCVFCVAGGAVRQAGGCRCAVRSFETRFMELGAQSGIGEGEGRHGRMAESAVLGLLVVRFRGMTAETGFWLREAHGAGGPVRRGVARRTIEPMGWMGEGQARGSRLGGCPLDWRGRRSIVTSWAGRKLRIGTDLILLRHHGVTGAALREKRLMRVVGKGEALRQKGPGEEKSSKDDGR